MKANRFLESMGLLDDKYVEEARHTPRKSRSVWLRVGALAACVCIIFSAVGLWLFLPFDNTPENISRYSDSPYFPVIAKLNQLTYRQNTITYKNNFDKILSTLKDKTDCVMSPAGTAPDMDEDMDMAPGDVPESGGANDVGDGSQYVETTDNQVAGVIEADIIKRSDTHIYYLRGNTLSVYSIDGEDSKEVGTISVGYVSQDNARVVAKEMYLSSDCKTVTVLMTISGFGLKTQVRLVSLDVSDPANIKEQNSFSVSGSYLTSRSVNGKLLLLTEFYVAGNCDFSKEEEFLPQVDTGTGMESIPPDAIIAPDTLTSTRYTVVSVLDESTLDTTGCSAFLSYSQEAYVSQNSIYLTRSFVDEEEPDKDGVITRQTMTEISRLHYAGEHLEYKGSVTLAGYIKDQYSLDEYENILRVVTTTNVSSYRRTSYGGTISVLPAEPSMRVSGTNASLYCVDLATLDVVAKVEHFAPQGEIVQSVRFDKDTAYVCTSIRLSDPVFFFDLSDLSNITFKDTGTIEGFSSSLINFGDGFLLGIGRGNSWDTVKIEVYEESTNGVVSVDSVVYENSYYSTEYKSYLINRDLGLVGLAIPDNGHAKYKLFHFDGYRLTEVVNTDLGFGDPSLVRAVYIDQYLYLFADHDFKVVAVN